MLKIYGYSSHINLSCILLYSGTILLAVSSQTTVSIDPFLRSSRPYCCCNIFPCTQCNHPYSLLLFDRIINGIPIVVFGRLNYLHMNLSAIIVQLINSGSDRLSADSLLPSFSILGPGITSRVPTSNG
ncbi:hypothetical protein GALMADRAFT_731001 [Galerina marginata CBS 339.88]|uniref:Uncharacterized protein n=1 Tax=Galerina marginata (strain CBS 339.88) TaxID=685588 RepID=A0A067SR40_GALM3|nr:hypothetical protein GALMADRAFT_731001 [Galerina marginata CBS 339.88]